MKTPQLIDFCRIFEFKESYKWDGYLVKKITTNWNFLIPVS